MKNILLACLTSPGDRNTDTHLQSSRYIQRDPGSASTRTALGTHVLGVSGPRQNRERKKADRSRWRQRVCGHFRGSFFLVQQIKNTLNLILAPFTLCSPPRVGFTPISAAWPLHAHPHITHTTFGLWMLRRKRQTHHNKRTTTMLRLAFKPADWLLSWPVSGS